MEPYDNTAITLTVKGEDGTITDIENRNVTHIRQLLTIFKAAAVAAGFDWVEAVQVLGSLDDGEVLIHSSED